MRLTFSSSNLISSENPLILASDSPRRRDILTQLRIPFRQVSSNSEEKKAAGDPMKDVCLIAERKAMAVRPSEPSSWIMAADTVVVLGDNVMGKPTDAREAFAMLTNLGGKSHRVITGLCILSPIGTRALCDSVVTEVRFRDIAESEINAYIATGEPFGKAGAYAIQGIGAFMVEGITGSYTNVVGLPACVLVKALIEAGAIAQFPIY
ncbi:MAG: septum formation protein Maf [Deltaproteobacteria bacterium CG23_combo_of_CG06-09_8_20_14_all_51_20]|nr:MAG: septum formation protein Maf [Deltaproteobacteria bacterium CG23_combo_of_CG06-09_8_20_14_all_51_20]